jgi:hypothetical protein
LGVEEEVGGIGEDGDMFKNGHGQKLLDAVPQPANTRVRLRIESRLTGQSASKRMQPKKL